MDQEETEYVVEAVRGWRYHYDEGCIQYCIKWKGYGEEENTWEPRDNLNCDYILKDFIRKLPPKQARYFHVDHHEKLTGFQRNATFVACVGADGAHESDDEDSDKAEKQDFYCLIKFNDSQLAFEVTIKEFLEYEPEEAFKFLESRIFIDGSRDDD